MIKKTTWYIFVSFSFFSRIREFKNFQFPLKNENDGKGLTSQAAAS